MEDLQKQYIVPVLKLTDLAFMNTRLNLSSLVVMLKASSRLKEGLLSVLQIFTHIHKDSDIFDENIARFCSEESL